MPNPQPPSLPASRERWIIVAASRTKDVFSYFVDGSSERRERCEPVVFESAEEARRTYSFDEADLKEFVGWVLNIDTGKTEPLG